MENEILCGDIIEIAPTLPDASIRLILTSPPYAAQREQWYTSVSEKDYPAWTVQWLESLRPKLVTDANILIVIRAHQKNGDVSDYVLRTRLAIRDAGWHEPEELLWNKSDGPPIGSTRRPRRTWEHILWYSTTNAPYTDLRACGNATALSQKCQPHAARRIRRWMNQRIFGRKPAIDGRCEYSPCIASRRNS